MHVHVSMPTHVQRHKTECKHIPINIHIGITTQGQVFKRFPVPQRIFLTPSCGYLTPKAKPAHHGGAGTGCWANFLLVIKKGEDLG